MRGRKTNVAIPVASVADKGKGNAAAVQMPDDMTASAKAKWKVIVPLIAEQCTLHESDQDALRQYCEAVVLRCKAVKELEDQPLVVSSPNGALQIHPLQKIIANLDTTLMKFAERFGLDPASRQRLKVATQQAATPLLDFMKHGRERRKPKTEAENQQGT